MDDNAIRFVVGDEFCEIGIQMLNHIRADAMRSLTPFAPIGDGGEGDGFAF